MNRASVLLLITLLLVGFSAAVVGSPQCCGDSNLSDASRANLEELIGFFAEMESVHMEAIVRVVIPGRNGNEDTSANGTFSFWEEDGRFRIESEVDPRLGLAPNMEFAFDGVHYQSLLTEDSTLSIYSEDLHQYPTAVPNPLFLLVDFLTPDQSTCPTCALFLKDFMNESTWFARLDNARESAAKSGGREVFVASDPKNENRVIYRITFTDAKLLKVDRLNADGLRLASLDFHNYRPVKEGDGPLFPRSITMRSFAADGAVAAKIVYEIETLEVDHPIALDVFSIPTEGLRVLDGSPAE